MEYYDFGFIAASILMQNDKSLDQALETAAGRDEFKKRFKNYHAMLNDLYLASLIKEQP